MSNTAEKWKSAGIVTEHLLKLQKNSNQHGLWQNICQILKKNC